MNTSARQTRGAENRKPTQKYALFQNKSTKKNMEEEKVESSQENDQYILKIVKQSISDKSKKRDAKVIEPTNNSTPEKNQIMDEKIEIDDLQDILDDPAATVRYNKSKEKGITLANLQQQKSGSKPQGVQPTPSILMPKRIMSAKKTPSKKKKDASNNAEELKLTQRKSSEKKVVNKKKDRSALVGLKRTRKSRDQIYQLQKCYEDAHGKPTKAQLKQLAKDTGLKLQQVYKWYWDTEKKNDKLQKEIRNSDKNVQSPMRLSRKILKTQYTDEFGGYSKTWFTDGLQDLINQKNTDMAGEDQSSEDDAANQDYGMDGLAKALGLDINQIAIDLAMRDDTTPPSQVLPINDDSQIRKTLKQSDSAFRNVESKNSTPALPFKEIKQGVLAKKQSSPIITPVVLRHGKVTSPGQLSHASASNSSTIIGQNNTPRPQFTWNRPSQGPVQKQNKEFTPDAINQAFKSLFGSMNTGNQQTPSFHGEKHQIKAQPQKKPQDFKTQSAFNKNKISSVFSPIPCKPQSQCSILGVRGDNNTPYTPFQSNDLFTPRMTPANASRVFKAPSGLGLHAQQSQKSQKQKITPGQFLKMAEPVNYQQNNAHMKIAASPLIQQQKTFNPFSNQGITPPQYTRMAAAQQSPAPKQQTTVINIYNQPINCTNFYQGTSGKSSSENTFNGPNNS